MEPMLLRPAGKDYLWGGEKLKTSFFKKINITPLAETWECSVHPDGTSIVASGKYKGESLAEVLLEHPEYLGSKIKGEMPVLVKFIDAKENLSVQVHPDDRYALKKEGQLGKTEMWYVLEADKGASLVCGFAHRVTPEQLKQDADRGQLEKHLQKIPVRKGDVFFIPPGTVHAIGAGILLAEIQENSNITYRIYDYGRTDQDGRQRELHFDQAMEVLDMKSSQEIRQRPRKVDYYPGCAREILCRCQYFETERIQVSMGFDFTVAKASFQVLLCIDGDGEISAGGMKRSLRFKKGECMFLPSGIGRCRVLGQAEMLKIRC